KFSTVSASVLATNLFQKSLSLRRASSAELGLPFFFGARPYQTISAHKAPADVPLKPTSLNRFLSFCLSCFSISLRISVSTPAVKAACIPPPWQATATFFGSSNLLFMELTICLSPLLPRDWLTRNWTLGAAATTLVSFCRATCGARRILATRACTQEGADKKSSDVRFGSKADICSAPAHVRFTPNNDLDCVFRHVRFGPR